MIQPRCFRLVDDTPAAPDSGTVMFVVTECDLFFRISTQASVIRMPENSSWLLPRISWGRPAMSGLMRSI